MGLHSEKQYPIVLLESGQLNAKERGLWTWPPYLKFVRRIGGDFICSLINGYVINIISLIINVVFLVILHLSSNLELQTVGLEHREVSV